MSEMSGRNAHGAMAEFRAGGTDLSERRRSGLSRAALNDLIRTPSLAGISWDSEGAALIGSLTTIEEIATDIKLGAAYPGLSAAAGGLATPQIRRMATIGGNLAQRSRCWYYRDPYFHCFKKNGSTCPARSGNHLYGVAFDSGPCVAPHPSTMAAALLAYDARIVTDRRDVSIDQLFSDAYGGASDNGLESGEMITRVTLPPPLAGERAMYKRATSRAFAEWPLVEVVARAVLVNGSFEFVRLSAGGVAPAPLRLTSAEAAASGTATGATIALAAERSISNAKPLPMTAYKLELLRAIVQDVLERLST
jgi:xanthine dehydrogenase YagS FAD-binding subunit